MPDDNLWWSWNNYTVTNNLPIFRWSDFIVNGSWTYIQPEQSNTSITPTQTEGQSMPTCTRTTNGNCTCDGCFVEEIDTCSNCNLIEDECVCSFCCRCDTRVDELCEACERCNNCCNNQGQCMDCSECDTRVISDPCNNCDYCCNCCECRTCDDCNNRVDAADICCNCCRCNDCECDCTPPVITFIKGKDIFHSCKRGENKINPSKRFISAEIEVYKLNKPEENVGIYEICKHWGAGIVQDGSLPESGFEINTAPAAGDVFIRQVEDITEALRKAKADSDNDCCGYHVHVDARDFSYWEVRRLIKLYALIEEALFSVVPESRRNNSSYCRPCGNKYLRMLNNGFKPKDCKKKVTEAVYNSSNVNIQAVREGKYNDARYNALNLHSWYYRGTVEYRLHSGTSDKVKIINWGILWAGIIDWVYSHTEKDISNFTKDNRSSWDVLMAITPTATVKAWLERRKKQFEVDNDC